MTTTAYAALQKQVSLLTNGRALSNLNLRLLEMALEGMNVPAARRQEAIQQAIQNGRDQTLQRREQRNGGRHAAT
jgi:hypothetical protein